MKYANLVIGLVLFSVFTYVLLDFGANMGNSLETTNTNELEELRGDYSLVDDVYTEGDPLRDIEKSTDSGQQQSDANNFYITGALQGTKLIGGSFDTLKNIINTIQTDLGINPIFSAAGYAIVFVIIGLSILFMIMRFRAEV